MPEYENDYPEPSRFGTLPSWGLFARHVRNLNVDRLEVRVVQPDRRPAMILSNAEHVQLDRVDSRDAGDGPVLVVQNVSALRLQNCPGLPDLRRDHVVLESLPAR